MAYQSEADLRLPTTTTFFTKRLQKMLDFQRPAFIPIDVWQNLTADQQMQLQGNWKRQYPAIVCIAHAALSSRALYLEGYASQPGIGITYSIVIATDGGLSQARIM